MKRAVMHFYRCNDCGYTSRAIDLSVRRGAAIRRHLNTHGCNDDSIVRWTRQGRVIKLTCLECGKLFTKFGPRQMFCTVRCVAKHRRRVSRVAGFCIACHNRRPVPGQTLCEDCAARQQEASKRWADKQRELGLCRLCIHVAVYGDYCYEHHHKRERWLRERRKRRTLERFVSGFCTKCGNEPAIDGFKWGALCRAKERERKLKG